MTDVIQKAEALALRLTGPLDLRVGVNGWRASYAQNTFQATGPTLEKVLEELEWELTQRRILKADDQPIP